MNFDGGVLGMLIRALAYISVADEQVRTWERVADLGQARAEIESALLALEQHIIAAEAGKTWARPRRCIARGTAEFGDPGLLLAILAERNDNED
jgi:hypothetical protein